MDKMKLALASLLVLVGCGNPNAPKITQPYQYDGINFGVDNGAWSNDGNCDDPRFYDIGNPGGGLKGYVGNDASDCYKAYLAGTSQLHLEFR